MLTLLSLISGMALSALIGKRFPQMNVTGIILVSVIALLQVGIVLFDVFTVQSPSPY